MTNFVQKSCYTALLAFTLVPHLLVVPVSVQVISAAFVVVFITSTLALAVELKFATREETEIIEAKGAYMFPLQVFGLQLLLSILFKLLNKDPVSLVSKPYLAILGVYTIAEVVSPLLSKLLITKFYTHEMKVPFYGVYKLELSQAWILTSMFAAAFAAAWFQTNHYLLDGAFLILLVAKCTMLLAVGSLKTGVILLCNLLLCYGDTALPVLLPSTVGSLFLRYDAHRAHVVCSVATFPTPATRVNVLVYLLGLVATMSVLSILDAAQPALECVGPVCLGLVLHFLLFPALSSTPLGIDSNSSPPETSATCS